MHFVPKRIILYLYVSVHMPIKWNREVITWVILPEEKFYALFYIINSGQNRQFLCMVISAYQINIIVMVPFIPGSWIAQIPTSKCKQFAIPFV